MQDTSEDTQRVAAAEFRQFIERNERLEAKKRYCGSTQRGYGRHQRAGLRYARNA